MIAAPRKEGCKNTRSYQSTKDVLSPFTPRSSPTMRENIPRDVWKKSRVEVRENSAYLLPSSGPKHDLTASQQDSGVLSCKSTQTRGCSTVCSCRQATPLYDLMKYHREKRDGILSLPCRVGPKDNSDGRGVDEHVSTSGLGRNDQGHRAALNYQEKACGPRVRPHCGSGTGPDTAALSSGTQR